METEQEEKKSIFTQLDKDPSQIPTTHFEEKPTDIFIVIPPDGGWGWIVVIAAFFSFLISDGMIYTFGIFLANMSESFGCSKSKVALTGAIMTGFFCFTGPFVSALVNQFGCRKIAIAGSILASMSCALTSVTSSLYVTFLTHGIMGGLGFGMIYVAAVIAVGFYFEKWRPIATGIAVCGAGVGGITLPPILTLVLDRVGWRYTFKIMAGLSLGCAFCGLLYKPIAPVKLGSTVIHNRHINKDKRSVFERFHNTSHPTISDVCLDAENIIINSIPITSIAEVKSPDACKMLVTVDISDKTHLASDVENLNANSYPITSVAEVQSRDACKILVTADVLTKTHVPSDVENINANSYPITTITEVQSPDAGKILVTADVLTKTHVPSDVENINANSHPITSIAEVQSREACKIADVSTKSHVSSDVKNINVDAYPITSITEVQSSDTCKNLVTADISAKTPVASDVKTLSTETIFRSYKLAHNISSELVMLAMPSTSSKSSFKSTRSGKPEISIEPTKTGDRLSTVYEEEKSQECCPKLLPVWFHKKVKVCYTTNNCFCCRIKSTYATNNTTRPIYRDDTFYNASMTFLPEYQKTIYISQSKIATPTANSIEKSNSILEYSMMVTRTITQKELSDAEACVLCSESIKRTLATMLDFSLLKSPSFLLLVFNAVFTSLGFYTPYMFIKDRAVQHDVPTHMAFWLISCMGVTNTFGRIGCGILSTFPKIGAFKISYVSLFVGGTATLLSGLSFNVWVQFAYAALYGLSVACMSSLRTIIIVEMEGLQKLTNAIGIILMFQGVASLAGTSISGLLRDLTGDYQASFYFAGGCIGAGSLLLVPIKKVSAWEKQWKSECCEANLN